MPHEGEGRGASFAARAPGRLPTLYPFRTSPETLDALLKKLVPYRDEAPQGQAHQLLMQHKGNVHEVFFRLYETFGH